jgi:hypothetical protein
MRIWITASDGDSFVRFYKLNIKAIESKQPDPSHFTVVCRTVSSRLLRGSGKRLPKHGTSEVVEGELRFE